MSPASALGAISWTLILMTVLLALSLAAIVRSPPYTPGHAEQESASQPGPPELAAGPPAGQLPRRLPGESGRVAPANGALNGQPRVSGTPPWDPAPEPPTGIPPWDMP